MPSRLSSKNTNTKLSAYHHGDLRNALIAEGRRALEQTGVRDLSLRQVARSVGVSEAAPSRHFDGKDGLLAAIAAAGFRELTSLRLAILGETTDSAARIFRMMDCYVQFAVRHKGLFDLMVGLRVPERIANEEYAQASAANYQLFSSAVCAYAKEQGWPEASLPQVEHAAWSVEHGLATLIIADRVPRVDRQVGPQEMILFSITLLISAIAAGPQAFEKIAGHLSLRR
jgi:AcrR family transcriptional regulator